jgi:hypothetical protein
MERVDTPPAACPVCKWENQSFVGDGVFPRAGRQRWHNYHMVDVAPYCGCGNCGHVVYLKAPLVPPVMSVDLDGTMVTA